MGMFKNMDYHCAMHMYVGNTPCSRCAQLAQEHPPEPVPANALTDYPAGNPQAFKADAGKPDFDLLMSGMPNALLGVASVLTWAVTPKPMKPWPDGGKGYVPHSWQQVPDAKRRYRAALLRHQNKVALGELNDDESGLSHWYHIATNALFLAELESLYPEA